MVSREIVEHGLNSWHPEEREYWFSQDDILLTNDDLRKGLFDKDPKVQTLAARKVFQQNVNFSDLIPEQGNYLSAAEKDALIIGFSFYMKAKFDLPEVDNVNNVNEFRRFFVSLNVDGISEEALKEISLFYKKANSWSDQYRIDDLPFSESFLKAGNSEAVDYISGVFRGNDRDYKPYLFDLVISGKASAHTYISWLRDYGQNFTQKEYDSILGAVLDDKKEDRRFEVECLLSSYLTNNVSISKNIIEKMIQHPSEEIRMLLGRRRTWRGFSPTKEIVETILQDKSQKVKLAWLSKSSWGYVKATNEMIQEGLKEEDPFMRAAWISRKDVNIDDSIFDGALADENSFVRFRAVGHKNCKMTPERIINLLNDPSDGVRFALWEKDWEGLAKTQELIDREIKLRLLTSSEEPKEKLNLADLVQITDESSDMVKFLKAKLEEFDNLEKFTKRRVIEPAKENFREPHSMNLDFVKMFEEKGFTPSIAAMDQIYEKMHVSCVHYDTYHALRVFGISEEVAENLNNRYRQEIGVDTDTKSAWDVVSVVNSFRKNVSTEDVIELIEKSPTGSTKTCFAKNYEMSPEVLVKGLTFLDHGWREYDNFGGKYWVEGLEIRSIRDRVFYFLDECFDEKNGRNALILTDSRVREAVVEIGEKINDFFRDPSSEAKRWAEGFPNVKSLVINREPISTLLSKFEKRILETSIGEVRKSKHTLSAL